MNSDNKIWIAVALVAVLALLGVFLPSAQGPDLITTVPGTRSATNLDNLELAGTLTVAGATAYGGGFGATGCTLSTAGAISCDDAGTFGGGYGFTGCTLSAAGVLQCNGAATIDGTTTIGGGFGASGCTLSDAGVISCNGAATFASTLAQAGAATFAGEVKFTAPTQVTVTADSTIATAGYTVVPLYAAGTVGTATITGCETAGKLTILRNISNQSITITDTSTIMLSANAVLTQYDTLTLLGDGTNCLQLAVSNN